VSRRQDGREGRRTAAEEAAAERASREQSEVLDVRNQVLGQDTIGNRRLTAEEANDLKRGASREGVDAAAVLDFSRSLADLAEAADEPDLTEDEQKEHEAEIARDTAVAEEVDQGADDPEQEEDKRKSKSKAARRHLATDKKTAGMGGGDGPPDPVGSSPGSAAPAAKPDTVDGLPVVTIIPRKRRNAVGLDAILVAGRDAGVLPAYMRHRADDALQAMTTPEFSRLFHGLNLAGGAVAKAFLLKAALAHRPSTHFVPFAERLAEAGHDGIAAVAPGPDTPDEPPEDSTVAHVRLFWDPVAMVGVDEDWDRCLGEASASEPWSVPKWLRGVPRPALDLCIVALELALQGVLADDERTDSGASDALAKAFEAEGVMHPSLRRWLGSILARAEDRSGLLAAREAMMRARIERARPWRAPADRQVWR